MATENTEFPDYSHLNSRNAATRKMKADQINLPSDQQGYWYKGKLYEWEGVGPSKRPRVTAERRWEQRVESAGKPKSRYGSQAPKAGVRRARLRGQDGKVYSSLEQKELAYKKIAEIKAYNKANNLKKGDPGFLRVEHRIQVANDAFWNSPKGLEIGRPNDGWNIIGTTDAQYKIKDALEQKLKGQPYIIDVDDYTGETTITSFDEFDPYIKAGDQGEIVKAGSNLDEVATKYKNKAEALQAWHAGDAELGEALGLPPGEAYRKGVMTTPAEEAYLADKLIANFSDVQRGLASPNERHLRNTINNKLNTVYTTDPSSELYSMGLWHDGETLDDSWVKITRELNTDSGTFANGKWTPSIDPTARTNIDILSDIGQGEGEFSDIVALKNKFHKLKRTLPPGEYYMHADNLTKAKYYQRAFRNDPWIGPSGEQGGMRMEDGTFKKYDTLKLTVPDVDTQFTQAAQGPYPRWQDQGVPQSTLSKATPDGNPLNSAAEIARRNEATLLADRPTLRAAAEASGGLKNALRKAGTVLPFVGAGRDAWDVQQRYDEMMNNPNSGFTDWLDKAQFGIASATLGTSFWAEPANFALGMTNLGIDTMRTIFEKDKREDFNRLMSSVSQNVGRTFRFSNRLLF